MGLWDRATPENCENVVSEISQHCQFLIVEIAITPEEDF